MIEAMGASGGLPDIVFKGRIKRGLVWGGGLVIYEISARAPVILCGLPMRRGVDISCPPSPLLPAVAHQVPWASGHARPRPVERSYHPQAVRLPLDGLVDGFNADGHARWGS